MLIISSSSSVLVVTALAYVAKMATPKHERGGENKLGNNLKGEHSMGLGAGFLSEEGACSVVMKCQLIVERRGHKSKWE